MDNSGTADPTDAELRHLTWVTAEQRAGQGNVAAVRELGTLLAARHETASRKARQYADQLERVVTVLAHTPGQDSVRELLRLLADSPAARSHHRAVAARLAAVQSPETLAATVFAYEFPDHLQELRNCTFHELLVRDAVPDGSPIRDAHRGASPLDRLPDRLRDFETRPPLPHLSLNGRSVAGIPLFPVEHRVDPPTPRTAPASDLRDAVSPADHEAVTAAGEAGNWGYTEAWVFHLDAPLHPDELPALLPTLPTQATEGLGPVSLFAVARVELADAWRLLFQTASLGGHYGSPAYAAYGRLAAWYSLAGLSGAPANAAADTVESRARATAWFRFTSAAPCFEDAEGSHYALAALSPDRRRLALLAAADPD